MRRIRIRLAPAVVILALLTACHHPTPETDPTRNLSPQGRQAYTALKLVKALDLLRDVAVAAEAQTPKLITTADTRKVVLYHAQAVRVIGAVPSGWKAIVTEGLTQLQRGMTPAEWTQLEPFARLIQTILAEVQ